LLSSGVGSESELHRAAKTLRVRLHGFSPCSALIRICRALHSAAVRLPPFFNEKTTT